ncbi:histidine phosphatase family protein [Caballeronia insecticola]|uniref:histidine phosphatase family protein n=1 Tax=Caballeronia insecticola TaxID=758793 RepID=UPI0003A25798|nr:histidine phosphatase family protein [Caballeronia insecticola]
MKLILLCHAATRAMKTGHFPTGDEPAESHAPAPFHADDTARVIASPARVARETAARIARSFEIDPAFDDIDYGRWRGHSVRTVGESEPDNIAAWLRDPHARPHGGESIAMLAARVIDRMARIECDESCGRCIVVTHAIVVKAAVAHALGQPLSSIHAMDFAPMSSTVLSRQSRTDAWALNAPCKPA